MTLPANLVALGRFAFGSSNYLKTVNVELNGERFGEFDYADNAFASATGTQTSYVTTVNLGADVPVLNIAGVFGGAVTGVNVAEGNENYSSVDGVLFNGDGTSCSISPTVPGSISYPKKSR